MTYPTPETPFKTIGLRDICTVNNHHFKRLKGTSQWTEYTPAPTTTTTITNTSNDGDDPLYLSLIHSTQTPSEPIHWSLYVAQENKPGHVYQVTGDAEYMTYDSSGPVDITLSDDFSTLYQLAVLTQREAEVVKEVTENEPPPRAVNRRAARENCQGWSVRVIGELVARGVVGEGKLEMARGMVQPI